MSPSNSLTLHLESQVNRWLVRARAEDGVPTSERIRAGLLLWHTDPAMTAQVNAQAAAMHRTPTSSAVDDRVKLRIALDPELRQLLIDARADDSIPTSVRVRAVVQLWHDDQTIRALIDVKAAELRRSRLAGIATPPTVVGVAG